MEKYKEQKDRGIGQLVVGAFAAALLLAIVYVLVTQSGIIPGDVPTQDAGIGPEQPG